MLPPLVDVPWLKTHLAEPQLRIIDATVYLDRRSDGAPGYVPRSGRREFEMGHIPGAMFFDLVGEFADTRSPFPFTMPTLERFAAAAGSRGVGDETTVVVYSTGSVMWATRLWWMLRSVGFERVAVLDGGFAQWTGPISTEITERASETLSARKAEAKWVTKAEVAAAGETCLLNALSPKEFSGERNSYGRAGHIPGSQNVFFQDLVDDEGKFLPVAILNEKLSAAGALTAEPVFCYCGGGIASTMLAMALFLVGKRNVAVYDGSMLEWSADPGLPLVRS